VLMNNRDYDISMKKMKMTLMDWSSSISLFAYASSMVATPICLVVLMKEMGLNLTEGGSIETVRTLLLIGVLIISGMAAARCGKTALLNAGGYLLSAGLFLYALAPSYVTVLAAMVLVGLGGGFIEALINPLVQDLHPRDSGRYLNVTNAFFSMGVLITVLSVGELLTLGLPWRAIMGGLGFVFLGISLFFTLASRHAHKTGQIPADSYENPVHHARKLLKQKRFWVFALAMVCGGGSEAAYTFWSASYIQIHYAALPRTGALGTASFASGMIVGRLGSGLVRQDLQARQILISAAGGLVFSMGFFWLDSLYSLMILLFFAGLAVACFWPSIQSYAADRIEGDSTMLFILLSTAGIPGFSLASWGMGRIGDIWGLRASFTVIPVMFLVLLITIGLERKFDVEEGTARIIRDL
jgi:fucose permease